MAPLDPPQQWIVTLSLAGAGIAWALKTIRGLSRNGNGPSPVSLDLTRTRHEQIIARLEQVATGMDASIRAMDALAGASGETTKEIRAHHDAAAPAIAASLTGWTQVAELHAAYFRKRQRRHP
jgi:hypothetical protein